MKRLKILFITKDFSKYLERNFHYLQLALRELADVVLDHEGGEIKEILRRHRFSPDFILFNDMFHSTHCPPVSGYSDLNIPWGMIMHDLHGKTEERRAFLLQKPAPIIFTIYNRPFRQRYSEFKGQLFWLPHFAEPSIFRDYQRRKTIDILMMGATNRHVYPLRHKMKTALAHREGFVVHKHPGYQNFGPEQKVLVARSFALEVNRSKIFLTCDSIYHYALRKYFEVPASNSLLMASFNDDLGELGFKSGHNFVAIDEHDFRAKVDFYLHPNNDSLRQQITQQGYNFIRKNHSTKVRAKQLLQMIDSIVG